MPREKRKTVIDQVAAGLILQDFMENTKKGSKLADSESDTEEKNNNKNLGLYCVIEQLQKMQFLWRV